MTNPKTVEQLVTEAGKRAEPENVYQKIARVTKRLSEVGIGKNQTNTFDKYKFRGIDDVYNALAPAISEVGLVILPEVLEREVIERESAKGGALFYVTLKVRYYFVSADDSSKHIVEAYGEAMDRGDKATNKAMSTAYKYACFQAFCIPTEAQDADAETHEVRSGVMGAVMPDVKSDDARALKAAERLDRLFHLEGEGRNAQLELAASEEELNQALEWINSQGQDFKIAVWNKLGSKVRTYISSMEKGQ